MSRSCFVMCSVEGVDADVRRRSDDLLDLVIRPALEKYGFDVVRTDEVPGSGGVNEAVVAHITGDALGIADLTARTPDVFYQMGRWHETGKPFILLLPQGETAEIDLPGIRIVGYSLDSAQDARTAALEIQRFVDSFGESTWDAPAAVPNDLAAVVAAMRDAVARIETKLDFAMEVADIEPEPSIAPAAPSASGPSPMSYTPPRTTGTGRDDLDLTDITR